MTMPLTPKEINEAFHKIIDPHESSLERFATKIALAVIGLLIFYGAVMLVRHESEKPLPPLITPQQRQHAKEVERRFSLAGWTWSVEAQGKSVSLYDPKVKAWRTIQ